jgi:hypothetical protein
MTSPNFSAGTTIGGWPGKTTVNSLFPEPGTGNTTGIAGAVESAEATTEIGGVGMKTLSVGHEGPVPSKSRRVVISIEAISFSFGR